MTEKYDYFAFVVEGPKVGIPDHGTYEIDGKDLAPVEITPFKPFIVTEIGRAHV